MNTDIRLSLNMFSNLKIRKLKKQLGADGVLSLIQLWLWCAECKPTGILTECNDDDIELAAFWDGESGAFVKTLLDLHLLDKDMQTGNYIIHKWKEHNPYAADSELRSEQQRLKRFSRENPEAAKVLKELGVNKITNDEYFRFKDVKSTELIREYYQNLPTVLPNSTSGTAVGTTPETCNLKPVTCNLEPDPEPETGNLKETEIGAENASALAASVAKPVDNCPTKQIIALYHEILPELPQVREWAETSRRMLVLRWREKKERQNLDWWREYFLKVKASDFLTGKTEGRNGGSPFLASLEWLVRPTNLAKVLNGNYTNRKPKNIFVDAAEKGYDECMKEFYGQFGLDADGIDKTEGESGSG